MAGIRVAQTTSGVDITYHAAGGNPKWSVSALLDAILRVYPHSKDDIVISFDEAVPRESRDQTRAAVKDSQLKAARRKAAAVSEPLPQGTARVTVEIDGKEYGAQYDLNYIDPLNVADAVRRTFLMHYGRNHDAAMLTEGASE